MIMCVLVTLMRFLSFFWKKSFHKPDSVNSLEVAKPFLHGSGMRELIRRKQELEQLDPGRKPAVNTLCVYFHLHVQVIPRADDLDTDKQNCQTHKYIHFE